jgi:zinc protease
MMTRSRSSIALIALVVAGVAVAQAVKVDRTKAPALGTPPKLPVLPVETRTLDNGLKLMIVEHHELPVADFMLVLGSGVAMEQAAQAGVARLTAEMLTEGTKTRNSLQIADQMAYLGVQVGASLSSENPWESSMVSLHSPTGQLDSALALFSDIVLNPSFPAQEFDRLQKQRLTDLLQRKDYGPAIASEAFAAIIFGASHPYGRTTSGTEASVKGLKVSDLQLYYQTNYRPNNATLIVVGDVKPGDIERRIKTLFGNWQKSEITPPTYGVSTMGGATMVYIVDKPGAAQSSLKLGGIGVPRSTKDYFALEVMNTILGGSFTSRLNYNLREIHGYTYGAHSFFDMRKEAGPFVAQAEVVTAKTDSALIEFMKELRAIRETVPEEDLSKAKRYLQLQLPSSFETTGGIAGQLVPVSVFGLPLDYYNSYVQNIEAVTAADVQRVAKQYVNPDSISVIVVGDRKLIESRIRKLNIGAISIRDLTGKPVK